MKAKIENDRVLALEQQVKAHILKEFKFYAESEHRGEKRKRITDPRQDFLMSDSGFERYCKLVYEAEKAVGINKPNWNTTADYKTRPALEAIEDQLLKFGMDLVPASMASKEELQKAATHWKLRDQMLYLVLRLG